ncbi:hypothetical protein IEN85_12850 [Pelagicoccus sp. NFK12]|uniref:Uncharacterized protein n=1 Tax=Pelagicoccus enzymogenes TaxID=2773457 RepID=A0A927F8Q3_9BACT|nr:hypothetical protein [Pelagicoccus enzymogenes]MBD5780382.1 hypothetical protein [Pelagicoccus enzymogenes]
MNKQDFIERLNLHLDEELSPEESEELLAEIRANPEYHRIYIQYCQLFNACSQLGSKFSEPKPSGQWRQRVYAYGGMAAAVALLLLAARNLTPMLEGLDGELALADSAPHSVNGEFSEPLRVMDVNDLNGRTVLFGDALVPVAFDLDSAFDRSGEPHNFGSESDVKFASFTVVQDTQIKDVWKKRSFTFGDAVETSTFAHEELSLQEAADRSFTVQSVGSAFDSQGENVRYELSRAAAAKTAAKP